MMRRAILCFLAVWLLCACDGSGKGGNDPGAAASAVASPAPADDVVLPPKRTLAPNPLNLPLPDAGAAPEGKFVYAVVPSSLKAAVLGHTLVFRLTRLLGQEGEQYRVRQPAGVPYTIHPAYVVPLARGRFRRRGSVLAPRGGRMHHAVVRTFRRKKIVVQYTDVGIRLGQQALDRRELGVLTGGLEPGGFAVYRDGEELRHVTLISRGVHKDGKVRWLALAHGSVALLLEHDKLRSVPRIRRLKVGADVRIAWRGVMTPGVVRKVEASGLLSVKRPRFGGLATAGPGMVLSP